MDNERVLFDISINNWVCVCCGEKNAITMVYMRLSECYDDWDPKIDGEDIIFQRPKYFITEPPLISGTQGKCYCSSGCYMNPKSLRAKL